MGSIVEGLLPTPLDVLAMEAQFAGSYEDAWAAIEERNTRDGIILGITAGIMGLDWAWVTANLWRRAADRDVETEILGAVGKAERAATASRAAPEASPGSNSAEPTSVR